MNFVKCSAESATALRAGRRDQRHLNYIKRHKKSLYLDLFLSGKLNDYLADLNERAEEMYSQLVRQIAQQEGVTETLKVKNQMHWVQQMITISERARKNVNAELVFI
ncbi:MAG: TnpV protein [Clostridia bacterium]|nr:TnpV protein [Clostridia bacterium]